MSNPSTFSHLLSTAPTSTSALSLWLCTMLHLEPSEHQSFFEAVLGHHAHKSLSFFAELRDQREWLAYCLAMNLLSGAIDMQGRPLIEHSCIVFMACCHLSPDQRLAALLHDCLEDGRLPHFDNAGEHECQSHAIKYLIRLFFGFRVDELVTTLSRNTYPKDRTYIEYINHIANYPDAIPIKLADLHDNLDPTRGPIPDSLRQRYEEAVKVLEGAQADREETAMFKEVYDYTMSDNIYEQRARVVPPDQLPEPMCRCTTAPIDKGLDSTLITEQEAALDSYSLSSLAELEPSPDSDPDFDPTYSAECDMVWIGDDFKEVG